MLTHCPPKGTLDGGGRGCASLLRAVCRARPLVHAFGHCHSGYGTLRKVPTDSGEVGGGDAESGEEVLFINAAIDGTAPEAPFFFEI